MPGNGDKTPPGTPRKTAPLTPEENVGGRKRQRVFGTLVDRGLPPCLAAEIAAKTTETCPKKPPRVFRVPAPDDERDIDSVLNNIVNAVINAQSNEPVKLWEAYKGPYRALGFAVHPGDQ